MDINKTRPINEAYKKGFAEAMRITYETLEKQYKKDIDKAKLDGKKETWEFILNECKGEVRMILPKKIYDKVIKFVELQDE